MRALLLILIASSALGQGRFDRVNKRTDQGRSSRGLLPQSGAFFEFAPASGAGMGTACACAAITGARGEALTFTRTGNATCSKQGLATTGIANGDLVVCGGNLPRVESSGGVLGLRVESARTNSVLRSEEFDNAVWVDDSSPVSAITITANQATAPDGTVTAERFQIPARTAAQWSLRRQAIAAGSTGSASVYLKGNGTSGIVSLIADGALATCVDCAFNSSTWTRCTLSAGGSWIFIGSASGYGACAGGARAAEDVFVWGAQTEGAGVATYATSYIPTVSAAVTRNAETPTATLPVDLTSTTICSAATIVPLWSTSGQVPAFGTVVGWAAPMLSLLSFPAGAARYFTSAGSVGVFQSGAQRLVGRDDNTNITLSINGTTTTAAAGASVDRWTTTVGIGGGASGASIDGLIGLVQLDPSPSRCTQ